MTPRVTGTDQIRGPETGLFSFLPEPRGQTRIRGVSGRKGERGSGVALAGEQAEDVVDELVGLPPQQAAGVDEEGVPGELDLVATMEVQMEEVLVVEVVPTNTST